MSKQKLVNDIIQTIDVIVSRRHNQNLKLNDKAYVIGLLIGILVDLCYNDSRVRSTLVKKLNLLQDKYATRTVTSNKI